MGVNSAITVEHFVDTTTYFVSSYVITISGATLSFDGNGITITVDWFKAAKDH